jgi:hypothetical protein
MLKCGCVAQVVLSSADLRLPPCAARDAWPARDGIKQPAAWPRLQATGYLTAAFGSCGIPGPPAAQGAVRPPVAAGIVRGVGARSRALTSCSGNFFARNFSLEILGRGNFRSTEKFSSGGRFEKQIFCGLQSDHHSVFANGCSSARAISAAAPKPTLGSSMAARAATGSCFTSAIDGSGSI